jgi:hypothetical protein
MCSGDLIDDNGLVGTHNGQVHRFPGVLGQLNDERPDKFGNAELLGGTRQRQQCRTEAHTTGGRRRDHQVYVIESLYDPLHCRAGQADKLSNLA